METPISDFIREYAGAHPVRLHMPGHKGAGDAERFDITEIPGADSLYEADGMIAQSEKNAAGLFGTAASFYSAEGASLCIRAMVYLAQLAAKRRGLPETILAGRNAHKTFVTAAGLLGSEADWLTPENGTLLSGEISPAAVEAKLKARRYAAVYITSPDYLGGMADIAGIAAVCKRYGTLLLADNAHGAYLRFLETDRHPIAAGADIVCDSAHKTLPALTGGAYLHFGAGAKDLIPEARHALALFGSTSPSYLILLSLDEVNRALAGDFPQKLRETCRQLDRIRQRIAAAGFPVYGAEPMKLTVTPKAAGYTGAELAGLLAEKGFICEYSDPDCAVMMPSPCNDPADLEALAAFFETLPKKPAILRQPPRCEMPPKALPLRRALLSDCEKLPIAQCEGRVCAAPCVSCPPAVPPVCCGETVTAGAMEVMRYYGITHCYVVKEPDRGISI